MRRKKIRTFKDLRPGDEVLVITGSGSPLRHNFQISKVQGVSEKGVRMEIRVEDYVVTAANFNGFVSTVLLTEQKYPTTVWSDFREGLNSQWANLKVLKSNMTLEEIVEVTQSLIEIDNEVEKKNLW